MMFRRDKTAVKPLARATGFIVGVLAAVPVLAAVSRS
jgi:hypothetical protein